ncbi:MAG TPA: hypothetical protein VG675_11005 [Bryobacteraceae bacterium]|nr:hypothetical protein [Bryobacteraceae bacterium]
MLSKAVLSRNGSLLALLVVWLAAYCPQAKAAHGAFTLDVYALRGPQDASAKLYISVIPADPGTLAPETLKKVQVKAEGGGTKNYKDVASPGGQTSIDLGDVPLLSAVSVQVLAQTDQTGNTQVMDGSTAVTEFALNSQHAVVPDFEGYGAQFNSNLYTSISNPANGWINNPPQNTANVEAKVKNVKPGLSRIFLSPNNYVAGNENLMDSFYKTVELAQAAGARVNITWWFLRQAPKGADQLTYTEQDMQNFANTLIDLVNNHGLTAVQEITIQNEVDSVAWLNNNKSVYNTAYRLLDTSLRAAGIRDHIKFVGGDLVLNGQMPWFTYMAQNMDDVLDGWSGHIYWNYWDPSYLLSRLNGILADMTILQGQGLHTKPLSITEYGIRGYRTINGKTIEDVNPYRNGALTATLAGYYQAADGTLTPIMQTNIAAFQQAEFNMQAVDDGFIGLAKWDFYRAQYDFSYQDHSLIGYLFNPAPGQDQWPLRPSYYMEWMMANTTGQHWQTLGQNGNSGNKLIAPFRSPSGDMTVFAMSTDQAAATFTIGDLPFNAVFRVLVWNADGSGKVTASVPINSGAAGVISVSAPALSVVALTTVAVGPLP